MRATLKMYIYKWNFVNLSKRTQNNDLVLLVCVFLRLQNGPIVNEAQIDHEMNWRKQWSRPDDKVESLRRGALTLFLYLIFSRRLGVCLWSSFLCPFLTVLVLVLFAFQFFDLGFEEEVAPLVLLVFKLEAFDFSFTVGHFLLELNYFVD